MFVNMASSVQTQHLLKVTDYVKCEGRTCFIQEIDNSMGFNVYHIVDIDSGVKLRKPRYQLEFIPTELVAVGLADDIPWDEEILETVPDQKEIKEKQFATVSGQELDQIELNRNSTRTKMQTNWGVGVFKGI